MTEADRAAEEYTQLREEKGADWRLITQTALTTLATTAAIAVGGLAASSRVVVVLAPLPFYLGVLYLIQAAWLQNRINTFIASRAPAGALNYEKHVLDARRQESTAPSAPLWAVSWYWWTIVAATLGAVFAVFPLLAKWEDLDGFQTTCPGLVTGLGIVVLVLFLVVALWMINRSETDRLAWETYWTEGEGAPDAPNSRQAPRPPAK